ncbi:MAG: DMT family transporter [Thermoanaerobaculum sp.]|nr:DMT family transporter [Thermoanaerobaculum sp.]MDW7967803.1 DMT family transporter [Thermoanaerobaculum sp.]
MQAAHSLSGKALVATLGMAVLFGTSFVASKVALSAFSPTQLVFARFAVATLLFLALRPVMPNALVNAEQLKRLLVLALLEPGAYFFLESYGLQRTLASTASVLIATIPVFVLLLEVVLLKAAVAFLDAVLIVLSLTGVGLLLSAKGEPAFGGTLVGNLLILGAAFSAAVYTLVARNLMASLDALTVTRWQAIFAVVLYFPFAGAAWLKGQPLPNTWQPWAAVLYLGVFCSFGAYALLNYALSQARPSLVAAFSNLIPVVATAVSLLVLGERLVLQQLAGAALTVGAIALLTLRHRQQPSPPTPG